MKFKENQKALVLNLVYKEGITECIIKEVGYNVGRDGEYIIKIEGAGTISVREEELLPYPDSKLKLEFLKLLYR